MFWLFAACCIPMTFPEDSGFEATSTCFDRDSDGVITCIDDRGDCNDVSANITATYEGEEVCNGVDDDCDRVVDEDVGFHPDADGDGHGDADVVRCERQTGDLRSGDDCDDANPEAYEGHEEVCDGADNDCDRWVDEWLVWYPDVDGDGFGDENAPSCVGGDTDVGRDCDDLDAQVHPDASERCNESDDNCDGEVDEETQLWLDGDADGWGVAPMVSLDACTTGHAPREGDCDDGDANAFPGAAETCEDVADLNCDGSVGSEDQDRDGSPACEDCDDTVWFIYPGAVETCGDGVDEDCDGEIDEDC